MPEEFKNHQLVFHSPVVFVPRLNEEEIIKVADDICQRLQHTKDKASDAAFFNRLKEKMPENIIVLEREIYAEDSEFVKEAVDLLVEG